MASTPSILPIASTIQRLDAKGSTALYDAMLLALAQVADEAGVAYHARAWADDLPAVHDALARVLHGGECGEAWAQLSRR